MTLAAFELPPYNGSFNSRVGLTFSGLGDRVLAMQLSPDGKYLALGNDAGNLEIRHTEPGWERTRIYKVRAKIRAILWHPLEERTLFVGCGNGNIYQLGFRVKEADRIASGQVNGFIHTLAMNCETNQLAVGFGNSVVVINKPFSTPDELGKLKHLRMPALEVTNGSRINTTTYTLPRGLYFLGAEVLLVVFFGNVGIIAYSTKSGEQLWKMDVLGSWTGSSALSPSGEHLVVTDLMRGVDWYSLSQRRFMMTMHYSPSEEPYNRNMVVGIAFLDESTVVVGHNCGKIFFCPFGMAQSPPALNVGSGTQVIQTICCGLVNGTAFVLAVIPVDEQDEKQPHIGITPVPQIVVVHVQNKSSLRSIEREKDYSKSKCGGIRTVDIQAATKLRADGWFIGARQLMLASIMIFAGLWQYWPQVTDLTSRWPKFEAKQSGCKTTVKETATTTERATVTESSTGTATETIKLIQTVTAKALTYTETMTVASPDCVCTVTSTVLDYPLNIGQGAGEEMDEDLCD